MVTLRRMKSGFVTLVGRSNAGKSTLLNTLVGTKISAVSEKPQMTRQVIHGVMNIPEGITDIPAGQAVFVDTPGILKDRRTPLSGKLFGRVQESLRDIDLVVYVVDPSRAVGPEERAAFGLVRHLQFPKILAINKSDLPTRERPHQSEYETWGKEFDAVFSLSALRGSHIQPLKKKVMELLPEGEPAYPEEQWTNVDQAFWIGEIVREKMFSVLGQEVPYESAVEIDDVEEKPAGEKRKEAMLVAKGRILTTNDQYKKMIIGASGLKIKEIGSMARRELEAATGKRVFLDLQVVTDPHWVERV